MPADWVIEALQICKIVQLPHGINGPLLLEHLHLISVQCACDRGTDFGFDDENLYLRVSIPTAVLDVPLIFCIVSNSCKVKDFLVCAAARLCCAECCEHPEPH